MAAAAAVIVLVTLVVMTTGRAPAVLALACALVIAGLLGIARPDELFAGLSNGGVITVAAMLVIAKGVMSTGVISRVTYRLLAGVTSTGRRCAGSSRRWESSPRSSTPPRSSRCSFRRPTNSNSSPVFPLAGCCYPWRMPPRWPGRRP